MNVSSVLFSLIAVTGFISLIPSWIHSVGWIGMVSLFKFLPGSFIPFSLSAVAAFVPTSMPVWTYGTNFFLTEIKNAKTPEKFLKAGLPSEMKAEVYSSGVDGTGQKRGRITEVTRDGNIVRRCHVNINFGGLSQGGATAHDETFVVRSEKLCRYAEAALMGQIVVDASFADRFIYPLDGDKGILNTLTYVPQKPVQVASATNATMSEDAFLDKVTRDPLFRKKLQEALTGGGANSPTSPQAQTASK